MSGTFRFSFDADYEQDKTNPQDTLPNISYEFQTANSTLDDVTTKDIQFHFNAFLRALGYVIDYDDDSNYTINEQVDFDDGLVEDNVLNIGTNYSISINNLAKMIFKILGKNLKMKQRI